MKRISIERVRVLLTSNLGCYLDDPHVDVNAVGCGSRVSMQGGITTAAQDITPAPLTLSRAVGRAGINAESAGIPGLMIVRVAGAAASTRTLPSGPAWRRTSTSSPMIARK